MIKTSSFIVKPEKLAICIISEVKNVRWTGARWPLNKRKIFFDDTLNKRTQHSSSPATNSVPSFLNVPP
jgi:hypothetical protein